LLAARWLSRVQVAAAAGASQSWPAPVTASVAAAAPARRCYHAYALAKIGKNTNAR